MKKFLVVSITTLAVLSLGLAQIHCGGGGDDYECTSSDECDPGYFCDLTVHICKQETCTPQCTGKCCGSDGCDGECPEVCPQAGTHCDRTTCACVTDCQPDCSLKECGPDGCGGTCGPGCAANQTCDATGTCICDPVCTGKICGPDGCGGDCAPGCGDDEVCNATGTECIYDCTPDCDGKVCGDDTCGGICPPGCNAGQACVAGQCETIQPHDGAGQACNCTETECSIPCPEAAGAAGTCLITDSPNDGDGFCTFQCSAEGADAECDVDFDNGCCAPTGTPGTFVCYIEEYCGGAGDQDYKDPCGTGIGNCMEAYMCISGFGPSGEDGYCVYSCAFPDGTCTDGGACAPTTVSGEGWCQPPGTNIEGDLCEPPLDACHNGVLCLSGANGSYCGADCNCSDGSGCPGIPITDVCAWGFQDDLGNFIACYCGYECTTASDCPNGGTGWACLEGWCDPA